ncbi:class II aldolase/adducin family protein [Streptomyces globisporus]|uniref:class II aldolase/adducin family protein n=1 Tax=Streptomyces sp. MCL20-2 TaxID=2967219 RepID=UPI002965D26B|nr:class II aldolase/adducin family protein [Streptomyces sp. MCL20-2]
MTARGKSVKPVRVHEDVELHRARVLLACRSLDRSGPPGEASGCVSIRSGEAVVISTGGMDGESPGADPDAVLIDPEEGLPLLGESAWPPPGTPVHLAIHRRVPGGGAVIHTCEPTTVSLAELVAAAPSTGATVLRVAPDRRVMPGRDEVAGLEMLMGLSGHEAAVLFDGRGVFTWGRSPDEALSKLERIRTLGRTLAPTAPVGPEETEGKTW